MGQEVSHEGQMGDPHGDYTKKQSSNAAKSKNEMDKREEKIGAAYKHQSTDREANVTFNSAPVVAKPVVVVKPEVTPTRYEGIKELDEKENWVERTTVVTNCDHQVYTDTAQQILGEVLDKLPLTTDKVDKTEVTDSLAEKEEQKQADQNKLDTAPTSDQNVTSDEDFNTPPTTPSKELLQAHVDQKTEETQDVIPALKNKDIKLLAAADVNPNDTLDDLADIIGGLTLGSGKSTVSTAEDTCNSVEFQEAVPPPSSNSVPAKDTELATNIKKVEPRIGIVNAESVGDKGLGNTIEGVLPEEQDTVVPSDISKSDTFDSGVVDDLDPSVTLGNEKVEGGSDIKTDELSDLSAQIESTSLVDDIVVKSGESPLVHVDATEILKTVPVLAPENPVTEEESVETKDDFQPLADVVGHNLDGGLNERILINQPTKTIVPDENLSCSLNVSANVEKKSECIEPKPAAIENEISKESKQAKSQLQEVVQEEKAFLENVQCKTKEELTEGPEQKTIMAENQAPDSPILPKGAYNIDWDNFDDTMNPFETKTKVVFDSGTDPVQSSPSKKVVASPAKKNKKTLAKGSGSAKKAGDSKKALSNSSTPHKELPNGPPEFSEDIDPFKSTKALGNSPTMPRKEVHDYLPEFSGDIDPFKSTKALGNSPTMPRKEAPNDPQEFTEDFDPFKSTKALGNSPTMPRKEAPNDPQDFTEDIDPFKSTKALENSPTMPHREAPDDPQEFTEDIDPFKSTKALENSPTMPHREAPDDPQEFTEDIDPFKSTKALENSPTMPHREAPDDPQEFTEDIDPFKSTKALGNSPTMPRKEAPNDPQDFTEDIDPFKSTKALENSPTMPHREAPNDPQEFAADIDPLKSKKALANSPTMPRKEAHNDAQEFAEDIDPFKSTKALGNSPTMPHREATNNPQEFAEDIDPFNSKKALANSPTMPHREASNDPPEYSEDIDPFKSKKALANSPTMPRKEVFEDAQEFIEEIDPFKSKKTLADSPTSHKELSEDLPLFDENVDPFMSKKSLANSPTMLQQAFSEDPFKSSKALANSPPTSPTKVDISDPFKAKTVLANSPPPDSVMAKDVELETNNNTSKTEEPSIKKEIPKKKTGTGPKKSIPRKFKPPPKQAQQDENDEIQIFMPGQKPPPQQSDPVETKPAQVPENDKAAVGEMSVSASTACSQDSGVDTRSPVEETAAQDGGGGSELVNDQEELGIMEEEFRQASEVFSDPSAWDMLEKFGNNNPNDKQSTLSRQSLYLKFDPLVKGASPVAQKVRSHLLLNNPPGLPNIHLLEDSDDLLLMSTPPSSKNGSRHPAVRALADKVAENANHGNNYKNASSNGLEFSESSGADMDRMLQCSPYSSASGDMGGNASRKDTSSPPRPSEPLTDGVDIVQVLKYSQADVNRMRREWELETRGVSLVKERDYLEREQRLDEEKKELQQQNDGLRATVDEMKDIVAQFENTMTQLIAEKESSTSQSKDSITDLIRERDQALEDIQSVEAAFGDLHRRYEKTKQTLDGFKKNEDTLKKCVADYQSKLKKQDERYQALKAHAEEKLEQANDEIEKVSKATDSENARLKTSLKRAEMKISSLEADVDRKAKEITELTAICDELVSKVGH